MAVSINSSELDFLGSIQEKASNVINSENPAKAFEKELESIIISPDESNIAGFELTLTEKAKISGGRRYTTQVMDSGLEATQHSSLEQIKITISGQIYNVSGTNKSLLNATQNQIQSKFSAVNQYIPAMNGFTSTIINQSNTAINFVKGGLGWLDQSFNLGKSYFEIFKPSENEREITAYTRRFDAFRRAGTPLNIVVCGILYKDMRLANFSVEETKKQGFIEVYAEFVEVVYTKKSYSSLSKRKLSSALSHRISEVKNKGEVIGQDEEFSSMLYKNKDILKSFGF
jgi:hypothetical protein